MRSGTVGAGDERLVREALFYRPQEGGRDGWKRGLVRPYSQKECPEGFCILLFFLKGGDDPDVVCGRVRPPCFQAAMDGQTVPDSQKIGQKIRTSGTDNEGAVFPLPADSVLRQNGNLFSGRFPAKRHAAGPQGNPVEQKEKVAGRAGRFDLDDDASQIFNGACRRGKRKRRRKKNQKVPYRGNESGKEGFEPSDPSSCGQKHSAPAGRPEKGHGRRSFQEKGFLFEFWSRRGAGKLWSGAPHFSWSG